jgi:hypothetical protein
MPKKEASSAAISGLKKFTSLWHRLHHTLMRSRSKKARERRRGPRMPLEYMGADKRDGKNISCVRRAVIAPTE